MSQIVLSSDRLDIAAARRLLDEDHYALDKLKRRVLEYLAVRQLKTSLKVPPPSTPRKGRCSPTPGPPFSTCAGVLRGAGGLTQRVCCRGPSSASWGLRGWARPAWDAPSPGRWAGSSTASLWGASATSLTSGDTGESTAGGRDQRGRGDRMGRNAINDVSSSWCCGWRSAHLGSHLLCSRFSSVLFNG